MQRHANIKRFGERTDVSLEKVHIVEAGSRRTLLCNVKRSTLNIHNGHTDAWHHGCKWQAERAGAAGKVDNVTVSLLGK